MKLTLDTLKETGAFTGRPVEKEITWKSQDGNDGVAGRIAASICDEHGHQVFTVADVTGEADPDRGALDGGLTVALLVAIQEVNDLGKTDSVQKTKSGAN